MDTHTYWTMLYGQPIEDGHYETGAEFTECQVDEEALRRLPSRKLADELVRRIAVSQEKLLCSSLDE